MDDMLVSVPYTDQPPLEGFRADGEPLTIADQMFDPKLNQWIVLANFKSLQKRGRMSIIKNVG
ncbi:hypothetical protein EfmAA290_24000 [Enterococcus faecium]|nr:hypothetical protein EfmAA290_24000 [Enterococcus faecium]